VAMEGVVNELKRHGIQAVLVGVQPYVKNLFFRGGLTPTEGVIAYYDDLQTALATVTADLEKYRREAETGPIRIQPLHRQRSGQIKPQNPQG